jgi:hypothetical protein
MTCQLRDLARDGLTLGIALAALLVGIYLFDIFTDLIRMAKANKRDRV